VNGDVASAMQSAISTRSDAGNLDYSCYQADLPQGGNKTSFRSNEHRDRHDTPHCTSKIKFLHLVTSIHSHCGMMNQHYTSRVGGGGRQT